MPVQRAAGGRIRGARGERDLDSAQDRRATAGAVAVHAGHRVAALLYQRGELALHAGVVAIDGGAVAFCGPSSAGKSTSAAWFARRGYPVVSDDLCRVAMGPGSLPCVWASTPRLKLSAEALRTSRPPSAHAMPRDPADGKYHVPSHGLDPREPLRLDGIYLLRWGETAVRRLRGITALQRLQEEATYRPELLVGAALARNWQLCAEIARRVPVWELSRPREWAALDRVMSDLSRREEWAVG